MDYSISLLGDTHFDAAPQSRYHGKWVPRNRQDVLDRQGEFARNDEMWRERMPRLVAATATARRPDTAALLHMGDIVQGDCGDADRARFLRDGRAACALGMEDLPFLPSCGNHDVRGGGGAIYDDWLLGTISGIPGTRHFGGADYLWPCRDDAFVFADFTRPDPARLFSMLNAADGARHLFLVTHGTVAPPDAWGPYWFLFGEPGLAKARRELFARLLRLNAIVLCGHLHHVAFRRWERPEGSLVEFCANSVWREGWERQRTVIADPSGLGSYTRKCPPPIGEDYDGRRNARTAVEILSMVDEYRPGLVEYRMQEAAGHFLLRIEDTRVLIEFFPGDSSAPAETFHLWQRSKTI